MPRTHSPADHTLFVEDPKVKRFLQKPINRRHDAYGGVFYPAKRFGLVASAFAGVADSSREATSNAP